ncbi:MAG: putative metalloendopeptidase [Chitinophagaceae bacterium]|nr:putative metalloendopeptidase [Chitinophagaceae bacterium]
MKKIFFVLQLTAFISVFFCSCNTPDIVNNKEFLDKSAMDTSIKPGENFFLFVNGKWAKTAVIPPTESRIGSALDLYNRTKANLHLIVDSLSGGQFPEGSVEQKAGDFYASAMDSANIEKLGYDPVKPYLQQIDAIKDTKGLLQYIEVQQGNNNNLLFSMGVGTDEKNSAFNIAVFTQGGLGLPDRDYYFKTDAETQTVVKVYQTYVQEIFRLTGDDSLTAAKKTSVVYNLEKQMAGSHRTNVELRDPQSNYHKMAVSDLDKQMPVFAWKTTLSAMGINSDSVNVSQPGFYAKLNELLKTIPVDSWKTYLEFHTADNYANALSSAFVIAKFDYNGKALNGQMEMKPRWERMIAQTDNFLGDALGQVYVKKYFTADAKKRMLELVNNLQEAFEARINKLDWMSDSTKVKAIDKLHAFIKKIGYTDKWRDYSKVTISRNKYFENRLACERNEYQYQLAKVGKPVDKTEWEMTPPTINAYYNPSFNEIVFPAGILQFPFFDPGADDAINYGGIGMVIGHEMTHGFDDQGAQYDKEGNLKNWWSKEDGMKFQAKTRQVINLYNGFTVLDSVHVNGALTTGENIADIGGINIAYDAFKMTKQGQDTVKIDGYTPDQRFFLSLGQIWKDKAKDEYTRMLINVDPHSPAMYRVNGPLMNCDAFYKAFDIKPGDKMYVTDSARIKIW